VNYTVVVTVIYNFTIQTIKTNHYERLNLAYCGAPTHWMARGLHRLWRSRRKLNSYSSGSCSHWNIVPSCYGKTTLTNYTNPFKYNYYET